MKKNIIALAIASAVAAPAVMADAPTVYGQINVAIDAVKDQGMRTTDRDSRVGVKGSEDLGNGLKAVYKMEFGVKVGDKFDMSGRNAYVGLAGGFGTVLMGRHDTPFKMSQAKDLFGDSTYADIGKSTVAGGLGWDKKAGETRVDNAVAYVSPEFAGIKLVAAGVSSESGDKKSSLTDMYSVAAMYGSTKKGLFLSAAYNEADKDMVAPKGFAEMRVSAQYAAGGLIASAMYQDFSDKNSATKDLNEGSNIQAQLGYKMGALMPKVKYSMVDYKLNDAKDGSAYALGVDYAFGKKTTGYIEYVATDKNIAGANQYVKDMADATVTAAQAAANYDNRKASDAISVGIVHKF